MEIAISLKQIIQVTLLILGTCVLVTIIFMFGLVWNWLAGKIRLPHNTAHESLESTKGSKYQTPLDSGNNTAPKSRTAKLKTSNTEGAI